MNQLKELQKSQGTGLRGSGRIGSLITPPSHVQLSDADLAQRVTIEYTEPGDYFVQVEGGQIRPATLRCGELTAYSAEEVGERKGTEYAGGRVVHVFRGCLKYNTRIREGPGSFHYGPGEVFEGRWKANLRFGLGGLYLPSGYSYEGHFRDDRPCGRGVETFPFGEKYVGEFFNGRPHGAGTMYYTDNGSRFEGSWDHGEKAGAGTVYYGNGDVFRGTWVGGRREGRGLITYGASGLTYSCAWHRDVSDKKFLFVPASEVPPLPAPADRAPPLLAVASPLGADLRTFRVVPPLWTEVHPAHFSRIKHAFEALDHTVSGEIEMSYLRSIWDPNNMETLHTLDKAAATVGADDTLELIEVLTGLYPHLPSSETRRWVLTDLPIEYVWRLRGALADLQSSRPDGFYTLTGGKDLLTRRHLVSSKGCVGGVRISRAMFVRNRILHTDGGGGGAGGGGGGGGAASGGSKQQQQMGAFSRDGGVDSSTAAAAAGGGDPSGGGDAAAGGVSNPNGTHAETAASFRANAAAATDAERMTFPQLLEQIFPNIWKEFLVRCEVTLIPRHALEGYSRSFDELDTGLTGYLSLEAMKVGQKRFQIALSRGLSAVERPETSYERAVHRSIFKHQARWLIGDISVTVTFLKQVDSRLKSGFVSLAEVLRYAFPNVPCAATKERLAGPSAAGGFVGVGTEGAGSSGVAGGADDGAGEDGGPTLCRCCICQFCSAPRFNRPRPPNPYVEGYLSW